MSKPKVFFQDFLFENMPVDEQDYPSIGLQYLPEEADISDYKIVSFDTMLRMNKRSEWNNLFKQVEDKNVCIKDDVLMENDEMKSYKDFYLKAYYYNLSKYCNNLYVAK